MNSLKKRQVHILKKLYYSVSPIDVDTLCDAFDVSLRTIRYDMNQIRLYLEEHDIELYTKVGLGYSIRNRDKLKLFNLLELELSSGDLDEKNQRKEMMMFELATYSKPISLASFSEMMFLSESSISKLIQEMNTEFKAKGFEIATTASGYCLQGKETAIRLYLTDRIQEIISKHYNLLDYYEVLPHQVTLTLNKDHFRRLMVALDYVNQRYDVWLSQQTFTHLIAYLIVADIRMKLGCKQDYQPSFDMGIFSSERTYTEKLFKQWLNREQSRQEIDGLIAFLVQEGIFVHNVKSKTSSTSNALVSEIIAYLKENKYLMDYETLADDLNKHISVSMKRQKAEFVKDTNPLLNQIKQHHSEHFELAKHINEAVVKVSQYSYEMNEDELSYLAIYLYKNAVSKPNLEHPKVYVACASSRGVSKLIETRIKHVFPQIEVLGTLTINQMLHKQTYDDADFIISTIPVENTGIPVIHVTQLLNVKDIEQIQLMLSYGLTSRVIPNTSRSTLNEFIKKQFEHFKENTFVSVEKLSKVLLSVLDVLMSLEVKYHVTDQKILGILIHCVLAIPRWLEAVDVYDETVTQMLYDIEVNHELVYSQLEAVFDVIEQELNVVLNKEERLSFFDYIVERND